MKFKFNLSTFLAAIKDMPKKLKRNKALSNVNSHLKHLPNRLKVILFFALCVFVAFAITKTKVMSKRQQQQIIPVKVMRAELTDLARVLDYVGDVNAQDEAIVYPKVSGKIIEKLREDGAYVNKGDTILYIDRDEIGLTFERAPVQSPLTGVVGRVYVDIGANVTPQTAVALVVNMDKMKVCLEIPEQYLPKITLGQRSKVSVDAYPGEEFAGEVSKISPVVDIATRTAPIEIVVDNKQHRLKSGMFAKVRLIIDEHKNVVAILKEAIIGREPDTYVYVVEDKKAVLKKIALGIRQGPYFEIKEGLKEGEFVVIMGQQLLREGIAVEPEE